MLGFRILNRVGISQLCNHQVKRTKWFDNPIPSKPEISNLKNDRFIKIGNEYYNPKYICSIRVGIDGVVLYRYKISDITYTGDDAIKKFTEFLNKDTAPIIASDEQTDGTSSYKEYIGRQKKHYPVDRLNN